MTGADTDNAFKITPGGTITQIIDAAGDGTGNVLARHAAAAGATWLTLRPNEVGDSWGQRLMLAVAEASEGGLAAWSGRIGAIHGWRSRDRLNRVRHDLCVSNEPYRVRG